MKGHRIGWVNVCAASMGLLSAALVTRGAEPAVRRPNVVLIYGDDVGYADVGVYGSEKIPTPNIDRLARGGLMFTDGHCTASTCSPSRFSMLTGVYGFRKNLGILSHNAPLAIPLDAFTLPKLFKQAGYTTAIVGKWHLGLGEADPESDRPRSTADWNGDVKPGPLEVGFDYSFLLPNTNDRVPCVYLRNHRVVNLDPNDPLSVGGFPNIGVNSVTQYPDGRRNPEAMTYYPSSHGHDHSVINGIGRIGSMAGGKSALWDDETMADVFLDEAKRYITANQAKPFFLYFSSQDIHVPRAPHPRFHGRTDLGYRGDAMVALDWVTGQLMDTLDELGLAEDTIVIFSSDNGPVYDDGYKDGTTVRPNMGESDGGHDASGPYRGGKYSLYEGGTRVPFIIRWPGRIEPGTSDALVSQIDFLSSFAALLNVEVPAEQAVDSRNMLAALLGETREGRTHLIEEDYWRLALRRGAWKYIAPCEQHKWKAELYNLDEDIGEQSDLLDSRPDVVAEMDALLKRIVDGPGAAARADALPPIEDGHAPGTVEEVWAGFDPLAEPLDVEVLKAWEHQGVTLKVIRYCAGTFKGRQSMIAAVYGYPKGGTNLPGLVELHGGGGNANWQACLSNARRGYATIAVAWAGRIAAPDYNVGVAEERLFWAGETNDPAYRITTDWGALDGYHEPTREKGNNFVFNPPGESTLDPVPSPRNSGWFLGALAARRALTFLEQQPEVDPERLGVCGFSMGGKLTVMTVGVDHRAKVAAPSCGGISDTGRQYSAHARGALVDRAYLAQVACPIFFHSPANDFHSHIDDLPPAVEAIRTPHWRASCSPHRNHRDLPEYQVASRLWLDQHLLGNFEMPATPQTDLELVTGNGVPRLTIRPDTSRTIVSVDAYYTQHGQEGDAEPGVQDVITRFWNHATPRREGDVWTADLPLPDTDRPLWVYANVMYELEARPHYSERAFNLSSLMHRVSPAELTTAGVKATLEPSRVIETFDGDWEKEWFTYHRGTWARETHKLREPRWAAPPGASLALDVRCETTNTMALTIDNYGADIALKGGGEWQTIIVTPEDLAGPDGNVLPGWDGTRTLRLGPQHTLWGKGASRTYGKPWSGGPPEFRNLRWEEL